MHTVFALFAAMLQNHSKFSQTLQRQSRDFTAFLGTRTSAYTVQHVVEQKLKEDFLCIKDAKIIFLSCSQTQFFARVKAVLQYIEITAWLSLAT